jgi:hypothetical protein
MLIVKNTETTEFVLTPMLGSTNWREIMSKNSKKEIYEKAFFNSLTVEDLGEVTRLEKKYLNQLVDQNISASSGVAILWEVTFRAKHELEELKKKTMIISTLGEEVKFLEVEDEVKNKIIENRRGGK